MTPTPEELFGMAQRVAIAIRIPRHALDTALPEVGTLIGTLCETTEEAERLTAEILRRRWQRWDFALFERVARSIAEPQEPQLAPDDPQTAGCFPWTAEDVAGLLTYGQLHHITVEWNGEQRVSLVLAELAARDEATAIFNERRKPRALDNLMESCRRAYRERVEASPGIPRRTLDQPYLDVNARQIAEDRIYYHLLTDSVRKLSKSRKKT